MLQTASVMSSSFAALILFFMVIKRKARKILFIALALNLVFIICALLARNGLIDQTDEFALRFSQEHPCRPDIVDLLGSDTGWEKRHPFIAIKEFKNMGAVRIVVYRENLGRLDYGFLYDEKKSLTLKKCEK